MATCAATGKHIHATKAKAADHLKHLYRRFLYRGHVYRCDKCGGFHVGRFRRPGRRVP